MPRNRAILVTVGLTMVFASGYAAAGKVPAVWIAVDIPTL